MSSFEHLDALRRQNKELLRKLKHKTENLPRLNVECWREQLENETSGRLSNVRTLANSGARDRTPLTGTKGSIINVSDAFIHLTVPANRPQVARNALYKPNNIMKTPNLAGEKLNSKFKPSLPVYVAVFFF